jgi:tetratricopeptide (TPR) repeat protein
MQGMLERMERRILELEHTAAKPTSATNGAVATTSTVLGLSPTRMPVLSDQALRIKSYLAKGHALLNEGKPKEAIGCYNEVLKIDLNHPEALVKRGAALERLKQDDEAIQCYDRAIKADSKMTLAYLYKGGVCNRLERYEEASKCYEQALRTEDETRSAASAII